MFWHLVVGAATSSPTDSPTGSPTDPPGTDSQTESPTLSPTDSPTPSPTDSPTNSPTRASPAIGQKCSDANAAGKPKKVKAACALMGDKCKFAKKKCTDKRPEHQGLVLEH